MSNVPQGNFEPKFARVVGGTRYYILSGCSKEVFDSGFHRHGTLSDRMWNPGNTSYAVECICRNANDSPI